MESTSDPEPSANQPRSTRQDLASKTAIARVLLETCFRNHYADLAQMLRPHIVRMGLASNRHDAEQVALDILADAYLEVQKYPQNYHITLSAKAWIVGFALNLLRRRRSNDSRRSAREVLLGPDVAAALVGEVDDAIRDDMGDRFIFRLLLQGVTSYSSEPEEYMVQQQAADDLTIRLHRLYDLIPTLDPIDQGVLRASLQTNFDCSASARLLGIRPGAARTRLHRAVRRLRQAYFREHPIQETAED